jgi:hypothetical protein
MPRTTQDREISSFGSGTAGSVTPYRCVHCSCTGAMTGALNSKASAIAMFCIGAFLLLRAWKIWNGWCCCWLFRGNDRRSRSKSPTLKYYASPRLPPPTSSSAERATHRHRPYSERGKHLQVKGHASAKQRARYRGRRAAVGSAPHCSVAPASRWPQAGSHLGL